MVSGDDPLSAAIFNLEGVVALHVYLDAPAAGSKTCHSGGVRVGMVDTNNDGKKEILTGAGPGGGPHVRTFRATPSLQDIDGFFAFDPTFSGGVFVGGS